jgi:hypothetical protein
MIDRSGTLADGIDCRLDRYFVRLLMVLGEVWTRIVIVEVS